MPFIAFLFILLFGAGFLWLAAYFLWKRFRKVALVLGVIGIVNAIFLLGLWVVEMSGWQRDAVYQQLIHGLNKEELRDFIYRQEDMRETTLLLMSQTATALRAYAATQEVYDSQIDEQLETLAHFVTNDEVFPLWKNRRDWEKSLYFLTHAGIVLAQYQIHTGDTRYAEDWERVAKFIELGITRSQYKHLASRPADKALRPVDNAASLFVLRLYDDYYGTNMLASAGDDWSRYIQRELHYEETSLPCAGFTATNRCRLPSVGGSLAMLNAYTSAAELPIGDDFWREFRFYYRHTFFNVYAWVEETANDEAQPEFCDFSVEPLTCEAYSRDFAFYAAATRGDWISYYQLNNGILLNDLLDAPNKLWSKPPQDQVRGMLNFALRLSALSRP